MKTDKDIEHVLMKEICGETSSPYVDHMEDCEKC